MDISKASLNNLYDLGRQGGRVRLNVSKGVCTLYIRQKPANPVSQKLEGLLNLPTLKRQSVLYAVRRVCEHNSLDFTELMENTGLSKADLEQLLKGKRDLETPDLNTALSKFVKCGEDWLKIVGSCGAGGYATVFVATNGHDRFALKRAGAPEENGAAPNSLQEETSILERFNNRHAGDVSYVVKTFGIVSGPDGTPYQALELALSDGKKLVDQLELGRPDADASLASKQAFLDKSARTPTLIVTMKDWLGGVSQTASVGIAHRDIKPANFLLTPEGSWKLTDFGSAGNVNDEFTLEKDTGNDNYFAKSPEWLVGQQDRNYAYRVGPKDDVFSFGAAAYGLLTGGLAPFDFDAELGPSAYMDTVRAYADSGMSFSEWHERHTGLAIPKAWQPLLNGAMHSDPQQRMTADQLRALKLFRLLPAVVQKARNELLHNFLPA